MKYAVIKTSGKQFVVHEKDEILVDKMSVDEGSKVKFDQVLMLRIDKGVIIGNPTVKNASVGGKALEQVKGKKIRVSKFKAKIRYRRTIGFRPIYTKVLIEKINYSKSGAAKSAKPKEKKTTK